MAERSQHGVSEGQDGRSERPATGHGQPRTVGDSRSVPSRRRVALVVAALVTSQCHAAAPSYERDITPILRTYCSGCHNNRDREGELSVETFASLRKGGADPQQGGGSHAAR